MAKGIIYCMTTIVPGLIKIGSTKDKDEYKSRMYILEHNGYCNITGLKRYYAVEVDDYQEQEQELFEIHKSGRVGKTELFAAEIGIVAKQMSRLKGNKIYPEDISEEDVIAEAEDSIAVSKIPNGLYYATSKSYKAEMRVEDGALILCKGSEIIPGDLNKIKTKKYRQKRNLASIINDVLQEDIVCDAPSEAASIFKCRNTNGWIDCWKTKDGKKIDIFRNE